MCPFLNFQLEKRGTDGRVALITLNRPQSLNALSGPLIADLVSCNVNLWQYTTLVVPGRLVLIRKETLSLYL